MDRTAYDRYLAAFNARDYETVLSHFAEDGAFEVVFAGYAFRTREAVRAFYRLLHAHVDERITVHRYLSDDAMVAMEAEVRLEGIADLTSERLAAEGLSRIHPIAAGQVITLPQFIHYHLNGEGKIVRALCAVFEPALA